MAKEESAWEQEIAYKLVELYVKELTERRDKRILDIEGLVEAYLYVLGRLRASEHEMGGIMKAIKEDIKKQPETSQESGLKDAMSKRKVSAGLLKALEGI